MARALPSTMTVREFENGYWYLEQLKHFAERIGIPAAKTLRNDELEKAATRADAIAAWTELKVLDVRKDMFPGSRRERRATERPRDQPVRAGNQRSHDDPGGETTTRSACA
jgi:hypothetical protein